MQNLNKKNKCPFCVVENSAMISESKNFRVIYNKYPTVEGHSLIITKRHIKSLLELSEEEWIELKNISNGLIRGLFKCFDSKSFDYAIQEGFDAGGSIDHFHIHVIPRKTGDLSDPDQWYPELVRQKLEPDARRKVELTLDEMKNIAIKIKSYIKD